MHSRNALEIDDSRLLTAAGYLPRQVVQLSATGRTHRVEITDPVGATDEVSAVVTKALFRNGDKLSEEQRAQVQGYIDALLKDERGQV